MTTEQGVITIYGEDIHKYKTLYHEWEQKHPGNELRVVSSSDLSELPQRVNWHWGHINCLNDGMYEISYDRFDTVEKALSWTLHMMDKNWLPFTKWKEMICAHYEIPSA